MCTPDVESEDTGLDLMLLSLLGAGCIVAVAVLGLVCFNWRTLLGSCTKKKRESPKVFAQSPVLQLHLPKDPRQPMFWSNIEGEHSVGGHSGAIFGAFSKVNSPLAKRTTPSNDRACPLQDLCPQPVINLDLSSRRSSKTSEGAIATTGPAAVAPSSRRSSKASGVSVAVASARPERNLLKPPPARDYIPSRSRLVFEASPTRRLAKDPAVTQRLFSARPKIHEAPFSFRAAIAPGESPKAMYEATRVPLMPHEVPSFSEQMRQASAVGGASVAQIDEARPQEEQEEASMAGPTADQIKAFCASAEALVAWEVKERSGRQRRRTSPR
eukprot:g22872.t1